MKNKNYTKKELDKYKRNSTIVKEHWNNQTDEYKKERTMNGLSKMNEKIYTCGHCGKSNLTSGNLKRHHADNCKHKRDINGK